VSPFRPSPTPRPTPGRWLPHHTHLRTLTPEPPRHVTDSEAGIGGTLLRVRLCGYKTTRVRVPLSLIAALSHARFMPSALNPPAATGANSVAVDKSAPNPPRLSGFGDPASLPMIPPTPMTETSTCTHAETP
jgi:hypothetical protein